MEIALSTGMDHLAVKGVAGPADRIPQDNPVECCVETWQVEVVETKGKRLDVSLFPFGCLLTEGGDPQSLDSTSL